MWALGCVCYEVLTLRHAFDAKDMSGLAMKIVRGAAPEVPEGWTEPGKVRRGGGAALRERAAPCEEGLAAAAQQRGSAAAQQRDRSGSAAA